MTAPVCSTAPEGKAGLRRAGTAAGASPRSASSCSSFSRGRAETRDLIVGPEPADLALRLLARARLVEGNEPDEHVLLRKVHGPAIGLRHGVIELLMKLLQDEDEAIVADALLIARERLARLQLLQHIVHLREGDAGMRRLHGLALRVELLRNAGDAGAGEFIRGGEGEGIETRDLV